VTVLAGQEEKIRVSISLPEGVKEGVYNFNTDIVGTTSFFPFRITVSNFGLFFDFWQERLFANAFSVKSPVGDGESFGLPVWFFSFLSIVGFVVLGSVLVRFSQITSVVSKNVVFVACLLLGVAGFVLLPYLV
jgi:hypothetical protein